MSSPSEPVQAARAKQSCAPLFMAGCLVAALLSWHPAAAETLQEALANAYLINPALNAQRAALRATDEQVAIAYSGMRPTITAGGNTGFNNVDNEVSHARTRIGAAAATIGAGGFATGTSHPRGWDVTLTQPIFTGFQNLNLTREAKATVQAGREQLRNIEQTTLLNAATAYINVVRDQAVVRLRENNVTVLTEQLKQTRDRFNVGEVTRTDVAQAEARRSGAIADLNVAQSNLKTSRAVYEQVIGHPPSNVVTPPSIGHLLPSSLSEGMTQGDGENPIILSAVYQEEASLYAVNKILGELLPQATLTATYTQDAGFLNNNSLIPGIPTADLNQENTVTVEGRVTVPLYQGGAVAAAARQAKETNNQLKKLVEDARLTVHQDVVSNWGVLQSTVSEIQSAKDAVAANRIALEGVQEEAKVGQRTTLDVLNAQLELVTSQIGLVTAERDRIAAEYSLCAAVGRLDAQSIGLAVPYYDPIEHYDLVKDKWIGLTPPPPPSPDE
jgi:outer membrane protein